jgi:hypothetical protein
MGGRRHRGRAETFITGIMKIMHQIIVLATQKIGSFERGDNVDFALSTFMGTLSYFF